MTCSENKDKEIQNFGKNWQKRAKTNKIRAKPQLMGLQANKLDQMRSQCAISQSEACRARFVIFTLQPQRCQTKRQFNLTQRLCWFWLRLFNAASSSDMAKKVNKRDRDHLFAFLVEKLSKRNHKLYDMFRLHDGQISASLVRIHIAASTSAARLGR